MQLDTAALALVVTLLVHGVGVVAYVARLGSRVEALHGMMESLQQDVREMRTRLYAERD